MGAPNLYNLNLHITLIFYLSLFLWYTSINFSFRSQTLKNSTINNNRGVTYFTFFFIPAIYFSFYRQTIAERKLQPREIPFVFPFTSAVTITRTNGMQKRFCGSRVRYFNLRIKFCGFL